MSGARWGGFTARAALWRDRGRATGKGELKPGYVLVGDETFLLDRCRAAVLRLLCRRSCGILPLRYGSGSVPSSRCWTRASPR